MKFFNQLYEGPLQMQRLNEALIIMILKKDRAKQMSDFRPTSMLNGVYKIIRKVLTARLGKVVMSLIDPTQATFMSGKSTLHLVASAQENVNACHHHNWEALFIKIDSSKAFDSLDWEFVLTTLMRRGFLLILVAWISKCLTLFTSSVLINNQG